MERNTPLESMLIRFYNMLAETSFRTNNEKNLEFAHRLIEISNDDVAEAKDKIRDFCGEFPDFAKENFGIKNIVLGYQPKEVSISDSDSDSKVPTNKEVADSFGVLEKALFEVIKNQSVPKIEQDIKGECKQMLQDFIKQEYGTIERKIVTVIDGEKKDMPGFVHEKFGTVLKFVANNEPVFLTGPAGSGKNYICKQVADALGLKFYFTNAVTQEYKLTGFTDANGNYQPTQFYKAFKNGGEWRSIHA